MEINERIKMLRKEKGLSQSELAKEINCSLRSVSGIEKGEYKPTYIQLKEISDYFGVSIDWLVKGVESENISTTEQQIIEMVRNDLDIKKTLVNLLETKKKAIQQIMMQAQNHELMAA
jgi:transcriptional regulator with XRE-family HTH domain